MAVDQLEVCNRALAHLPAAPIASIDEASLEARECRRFWPAVINDMLGGAHDWSFGNRRVALSELATNDRPGEYAYAYQLPSDLGSPLRVIPDLEAAGLSLPIPLPGDPYAETWAGYAGGYIETHYIIEGETLYSNVPSATIEYTIDDITGLNVSNLVTTAIALDLASRLAVPVKKNSEREKTLLLLADTAWQRAIADDRNRQPQSTGHYVSEAMAARRGYLSEMP